ncbi:MAG: hypothetical protein AABY22_20925, partial [Nanoarchaeota archaeon]
QDAFQSSVKMGQKVDAVKKLASELGLPVIAACQTNRLNQNRFDSKKRVESGEAIGVSLDIAKFASAVHLFQRRALDTIIDPKITHVLCPLYTRDLGDNAKLADLVKIPLDNGKYYWRENQINFTIKNFAVQEVNTLRDEIQMQIDIKEKNNNNGVELE